MHVSGAVLTLVFSTGEAPGHLGTLETERAELGGTDSDISDLQRSAVVIERAHFLSLLKKGAPSNENGKGTEPYPQSDFEFQLCH